MVMCVGQKRYCQLLSSLGALHKKAFASSSTPGRATRCALLDSFYLVRQRLPCSLHGKLTEHSMSITSLPKSVCFSKMS